MTKRLPNFKQCMAMMRSRDPQTQEEGFHVLLQRTGEHVEALMHEFELETDQGLRCWLLELIGHAKSPLAFDLLASLVTSEAALLRHWAIEGLKNLDTKEARRTVYRRLRPMIHLRKRQEAIDPPRPASPAKFH